MSIREDMLISLNDNVYLVEGKLYGCIYDFNTLKLYHINKNLSNLINDINFNEKTLNQISNEHRDFLNKLIENKILKLTTSRKTNSIQEIKLLNEEIKFAWIEVTTKCNLKCIHCYNESSNDCIKEMSINDFKEIIDSLLEINVKKIQIIGGEPFAIELKLKEMLDYVIGKFEFIEIFTNGTLISDKWIDYFKINNINIALSVYSYDENDHDKVTTINNSHKKTIKTIEKLHDKGVKYRVCNIIMKDISLGNRNTELYKLNPKKDILRMIGRGNISLISREQLKEKIITKDKFTKPLNKDLCQRIISGHNCFSNKIYIGSDKTIYPCVMERRINHGKLSKQKGIKLNSNILNFGKDFIDECRECEFRYTCFDCRPDSLTNNIDVKPWYCTYNPLTGEWKDSEQFIDEILNLK